jgi:zinc-ribbon domain
MSAAPIKDSACPSCGEELPGGARYCPHCGALVDELPPLETVAGPVAHDHVERRWLGLPARFVLLCLGFVGLGAAIGLFATGNWGWGVVALLVAAILLAVLADATRRSADVWTERSVRLAAGGRAHAAVAAEVWRTRFDTTVTRWRTRSRLDQIELERRPALQALGESVWLNDRSAQSAARDRLRALEAERQRIEEEHAEHLAGAEERIRNARLPVQETMMVTPNEPNDPYPPPDEGEPPQPAQVPEPYPPPDEGTPPTPAPDPDRPAE